MKMKRNLIILAVVLVLAVGLAIGAPHLKPAAEPTVEPTATPTEYLTQYAGTDVTKLVVENASGTFTLVQKDNVISLDGKPDVALDQTEASTEVTNLSAVAVERVIEENPTDLAKYGLDQPQAKATITFTDGNSATFLLGKAAGSQSTYYLMKQGDKRVMTAWISVNTSMTATLESLLAKQGVGLADTDMETVTVRKGGQDIYSFTNKDPMGDVNTFTWMITVPWKRSADVQKLSEVCTAIAGLEMGAVVEADVQDLTKYGLDKPSAELIVTGKGKTIDLLVGAAKDDTDVYVKYADSGKVYTLAKDSLSFIDDDPYTLTDNMILLASIYRVSSVQIDCLGEQGSIQIEQVPVLDSKGNAKTDTSGKAIVEQKFSMNGKELDADIARYYYQTLIGLTTHSALDAGWKPAGAPVGTITFNRATDPKTVFIKAYDLDKDFYAVTVDDISYFRMKKELLPPVADDLKALKNGTLVRPTPTPNPTPTPK